MGLIHSHAPDVPLMPIGLKVLHWLQQLETLPAETIRRIERSSHRGSNE